MRLAPLLGALTFGASLACGDASKVSPAPAADTASVETKLARFQAALPERVDSLDGAAPDRETLIRNVLGALAAADTATLLRMSVSRAEYAYLVYPESPLLRPPYRQDIEVAWMLQAAAHSKGLTRLLRRLGGQPIAYVGHRCPTPPRSEGRNTYWRDCAVRFRIGADTIEGRLFSSIVARDGRYNIVSYANDF